VKKMVIGVAGWGMKSHGALEWFSLFRGAVFGAVSKEKGTACLRDEGVGNEPNILKRLSLRRLRLFSGVEAGIFVAGCGVRNDARERCTAKLEQTLG
jgi:hypothetical protein